MEIMQLVSILFPINRFSKQMQTIKPINISKYISIVTNSQPQPLPFVTKWNTDHIFSLFCTIFSIFYYFIHRPARNQPVFHLLRSAKQIECVGEPY